MKRRNNVHYKKRTKKPSVRKQLILRKEIQKRAKYPIRTMRHFRVAIRNGKRSA